MASFTDPISQFNPYIQQLPVEAMSQVGMYKQQKYDEGIQKVQSYIDNVAGLDVVRDIDKAYLQGKLNELGSKLRTVAAGDFSNFQLVNSVGGMATQIVKDPNVQTAVSSTAWYRKQFGEMEKAISEGKSSQANMYDFNTKSNNWMNSNELGKSFKDRYTPYIDVGKKAMDAIKALHPSLNQYDIPFEIDKNGKINKKKIADAMKRFKIEGIDENQIQQAIYATLTPDDINQLQIDANYSFRNISPEQLIGVAQNNYKTRREDAEKTLAYLKQQEGIVSNPTESDKLSKRIEYYETLLGKDGVKGLLDEQLEKEMEDIQQNPDLTKLSIYKNGFVREYANAFSWKNQIESYETNPIRAQMNWAADLAHKQEVENRLRYEFEEKMKIDREKLAIDAEANALKKIELYGDPLATPWTPLTNETDLKLNSEKYFAEHAKSVANGIDNDMNALRTRYNEQQISEMLDDWKKNGVRGTKVAPDAIGLLERISKRDNYLKSLKTKEEQLKAEAEDVIKKKYSNDPEYLAKTKEKDANLKSLDANGPIPIKLWRYIEGGKGRMERVAINKTPSQILNDVKSGIAEFDYDRGVGGEMKVKYKMNGKVYQTTISKSVLAEQTDEGASESRGLLAKLADHLDKYKGFFSMEKAYKDDVKEEYKRRLSPIVGDLVPEIKSIARDKNGKVPPVMYDRIMQLVKATADGGYKANDDFSESTMNSMFSDENIKDTKIFIHRKGNDYELHVDNTSLNEPTQVIRLSGADVQKYFGPGYVSDKTETSMRMKLGRGNTNLTSNPEDAVLQKSFGDFPGISQFIVTADLKSDLDNPDLYYPIVNVKKKNGRYQSFPITPSNKRPSLGYDQGIRQLNSLTDAQLLTLLKEQYPNFDFSQLDY